MRWEIIDNSPKAGDVRFKTKFAWLPTIVLSKLTMTDHRIWLELYIEEQVKSAFRIGLRENYIDEQDAENFANKGIKYLTPIELPSDEEIEESETDSPYDRIDEYNYGFIDGANWVKQYILNQNK